MIDPAALKRRLADMNIDGWWTASEHHPSCDGSCSECPVPVQVQYSPDEIVTAILDLERDNAALNYTPATDAHPNTMIGHVNHD